MGRVTAARSEKALMSTPGDDHDDQTRRIGNSNGILRIRTPDSLRKKWTFDLLIRYTARGAVARAWKKMPMATSSTPSPEPGQMVPGASTVPLRAVGEVGRIGAPPGCIRCDMVDVWPRTASCVVPSSEPIQGASRRGSRLATPGVARKNVLRISYPWSSRRGFVIRG